MQSINRDMQCLEADITTIWGSFDCGLTGNTSGLEGNGVTSVSGDATGGFLITLDKKWNKFFSFTPCFVGTVFSGVDVVQVDAEDVDVAKTVLIQCYDITGGDVAPASGCTFNFEIRVRESGQTF